MGRLDIRICAARNLVGKPDPYVVVRLENQTYRTGACKDTSNPTWNEVFKFQIADPNSSQLKFELWNKNIIADEFLGLYSLSCAGLIRGQVKDQWYILQQCKTNAELHIRVLAHDFGHEVPNLATPPPNAMEYAGFYGPASPGVPVMGTPLAPAGPGSPVPLQGSGVFNQAPKESPLQPSASGSYTTVPTGPGTPGPQRQLPQQGPQQGYPPQQQQQQFAQQPQPQQQFAQQQQQQQFVQQPQQQQFAQQPQQQFAQQQQQPQQQFAQQQQQPQQQFAQQPQQQQQFAQQPQQQQFAQQPQQQLAPQGYPQQGTPLASNQQGYGQQGQQLGYPNQQQGQQQQGYQVGYPGSPQYAQQRGQAYPNQPGYVGSPGVYPQVTAYPGSPYGVQTGYPGQPGFGSPYGTAYVPPASLAAMQAAELRAERRFLQAERNAIVGAEMAMLGGGVVGAEMAMMGMGMGMGGYGAGMVGAEMAMMGMGGALAADVVATDMMLMNGGGMMW